MLKPTFLLKIKMPEKCLHSYKTLVTSFFKTFSSLIFLYQIGFITFI